jgi:hypothetical protein
MLVLGCDVDASGCLGMESVGGKKEEINKLDDDTTSLNSYFSYFFPTFDFSVTLYDTVFSLS